MDKQQKLTDTVAFRINLAAVEMRRYLDGLLRPLEITGPQWKLLHLCVHEGIDVPGDLARVLSIDGTAITRLLDRLEKQHLVLRLPNAEDRRSLKIEVTAEGKRVEREANRMVEKAAGELLANIPAKDLKQTMQTLDALMDAIRK